MDAKLSTEVWGRLISGRALDDLGLATVNERLDLRGLVTPEASVVRRFVTGSVAVAELGNLIEIHGVRWSGLDFSKARLNQLRLFDVHIDNCAFDGTKFQDLRVWGTTISNSSLRSADLRGAALGGVWEGKRNAFRRLDFSKADLRSTAHFSADFVGCTFANSRLTKVEFKGSVFVDCSFEGDLEEVIFGRHGFRGEEHPPNEMRGVDFSRAHFHHVEFRELDMNHVTWPQGDDHIIVQDYVGSLERALNALKLRNDKPSRILTVLLEHQKQWAGPNQKVGIVSKRDLTDVAGKEGVSTFLELIGR